MLPTDNPRKYLLDFFEVIKNSKNFTKTEFQYRYYRAILVDSSLRRVKVDFIKGRLDLVTSKMNSSLSRINSLSPQQLEDNFNVTLYNILKFHLDSFMGESNTDKTLSAIESEFSILLNGIFMNDIPFIFSVEDTTSSVDESKLLGSTFRIHVTPLYLLF